MRIIGTMTSLPRVTVLGFAVLVSTTDVSAGTNSPHTCIGEPGTIPGPLVPTEKIAKEIYVSIARGLRPRTWRKYPRIFVLDEGDRWAVGQTTAESPPAESFPDSQAKRSQVVTMQGGGGNLEMEIDKCTAAVSAHLAR